MQFVASRITFDGVLGYWVQQIRPDGSIVSSQFMDDSSYKIFFDAVGIQPLIVDEGVSI
jgi:hypothetical protein